MNEQAISDHPSPLTPHGLAFAIWITGLPASGKSTIVSALKPQLEGLGLTVEVLESDEVAITPLAISSLESESDLLKAPRILKEPVTCSVSGFR